MITLVTNTTSVIQLSDYPFTGTVTRRGKEIAVLEIPCSADMTLESVKEMFGDETAMYSLTLQDGGAEVRKYTDYIKMEEISWVPEDTDDEGSTVPGFYLVKLSQKLSYDEEMLTMKKAMAEFRKTTDAVVKDKKAQDDKIEELKKEIETTGDTVKTIQDTMAGVDPDTMDLPALKDYLIHRSKEALAEYLENNPIESSAHGGVLKRYSITSEKQTYLMAMIMMATSMEDARLAGMKQFYDAQYAGNEDAPAFEDFVAGVDAGTIPTSGVTFNKYQPSWNAVGEPCTYDWTINELKQLAAEIEGVVRPLISKQQTMELQINNAATIEDAKAVSLSFAPAVKMRP